MHTFSMHGEKNYPVRRGPSDLDIDLPDGTGDDAYLAELRATLPKLIERVAPDHIFYTAGVDPHESDRLGRPALSDEDLAARDAYVLETCLPVAPVVGVIGGGYDNECRCSSSTSMPRYIRVLSSSQALLPA